MRLTEVPTTGLTSSPAGNEGLGTGEVGEEFDPNQKVATVAVAGLSPFVR
jgi:hypothetical protein